MSKHRLYLPIVLIIILLLSAGIYLFISNYKESKDAKSSTTSTPSASELLTDMDTTGDPIDSSDIVKVLELELSKVQIDKVIINDEMEIKLGQQKVEVEKAYGEGVTDSNLLFEYTDYGGIGVAYLDDTVAYIAILDISTEVETFQFDNVDYGSSLEQIQQLYGTPYNPGRNYIEYYFYERDGQFYNIRNYEQLKILIDHEHVNEDNIKLLSIFSSMEYPDKVRKMTYQTYSFVKTQL